MATVTGTVKAVKPEPHPTYGTRGMMVDGKWYNTKDEITAKVGDTVEFDNGGKNYINNLRVVDSGGGSAGYSGGTKRGGTYSRGVFPIPKNDGQRSIIRQNSLTNAVALFSAAGQARTEVDDIREIIAIARMFEAYSTGDLDAQELQDMQDSFFPE